jgi:Flp pilus assembly protein TadD
MLVRKDRIKNSYSVLDNLDNIFISEDLTQAYIYAKKALENASTIPAVLDTHGWNSVKSDRFEDGLVSLRQTHTIESNDPSIRFHIAYTLQQLGRNGETKKELDKLLEIYLEFPERVEAKKSQASL